MRYTKQKTWVFTGARAVKIAVDPQDNPWIVTAKNEIKRWIPLRKRFFTIKGSATDISVGPEGTVFILGVTKRQSGQEIYRFDPDTGKWARVNGSAIKITVGPKGKPHILTEKNNIYWPAGTCYEK